MVDKQVNINYVISPKGMSTNGYQLLYPIALKTLSPLNMVLTSIFIIYQIC